MVVYKGLSTCGAFGAQSRFVWHWTSSGGLQIVGGHSWTSEKEQSLLEQCTFQPQVTPLPTAYQASACTLSREERLRQLARPRTAQLESREQLKRQQEESLSFKPTLHASQSFTRSVDQLRVDQRLYQEAQIKNTRREQRQRAELEATAAQFRFRPRTQDHPRIAREPLYQRAGALQQERLLRTETDQTGFLALS